MKIVYQKNITTPGRPPRQTWLAHQSGNVVGMILEAIVRRKIMMVSLLVMLVTLPILYLVMKYQSKVEAAWPPARRASGSESWMTIALLITIPSKYFVYLLKSLKDKKYYIGQTNDIKNRLEQHNDGKVISTKSRRPLVLIGYEEHKNQNEARWAEYQYKHHSDKKKKFIEKLLTKI